ncbi:MAG: diaminopimelate epimerase [Bacteroidetes bacterium]|nr:diaminopimelate epimerase [Bacteroidota bacterium]
MKFNFYKYQGTGNDFVIMDNRELKVKFTEQQINTLCDRRFGIGADGLMLLENDADYDFAMKYFNSDGKESTMCGNGGRCLVSFAKRLGIIDKETQFKAIDGIHKAILNNDETISLEMQDVSGVNAVNNNYYLNTGSPHYVLFRDEIDKIDVINRGREIRYSGEFKPDGTNVNFVEFKNNELYVRTYERGVENETLSCGTGATASAISASIHTKTDKSSYRIITKGGNLKVSFEKIDNKSFKNIWLTGPATFVFKGEITI